MTALLSSGVFSPCSLDDFLEIWGRCRQERQEWWGWGGCREEKESGQRSHLGGRARMWRWKRCDKIGEQRVTDGRRLGTDGEKQRGTRRDQESLAHRGTPGSWGDRPLEGMSDFSL